MTDPIWKQAPGHPGYEVSDAGEVRRTVLYDAYGRQVQAARLVSQCLTGPKKGQYLEVSLMGAQAGSRIRRKVHHLVLEAFVGPRPPGLVACHGPGGRLDNRLSNLRWDTQRSNVYDMREHNGGVWPRRQTHCLKGHALTDENRYPTTGKCKTCARERSAAQYAARKAAKRTS